MVKSEDGGHSPLTKPKPTALEVPSYAHPLKIQKYKSIEEIYGERPAYVVQKKRRYEQTVWIKDDDHPQHSALDVIGTSRTYYSNARWSKPPNFCNCPCEPKCHQSTQDFQSFSDEAWSSDDDDFSETYYNKNSELMCVRHERTGKVLMEGETIVPGVGVVQLVQDLHTAARNGRIFLLSKDTVKKNTNSKNDHHSVDWFEVDERKAAEAKERNLKRLRQFCHDEGMTWPRKKDTANVSMKIDYGKSGLGINDGKFQIHWCKLKTHGNY
jgi:hypothetical protein